MKNGQQVCLLAVFAEKEKSRLKNCSADSKGFKTVQKKRARQASAGMGCTGCATIAGLKESHPHDIRITKEAPNYSMYSEY